MTILLSMACAHYTMQVSDRLLTLKEGNRYEPWDRVANKAVVLLGSDGLVSMAYTGPAHIGGTTTDEWLANALTGDDPSANQRPFAFAHVFGRPSRFLAAHLTDVVDSLNEAVAARNITNYRLTLNFTGLRWKNRDRQAWPVVGKIAWDPGNGRFRWSMWKRRWGWESGRAFLSGAAGRSQQQAKILLSSRVAGVDLRDKEQVATVMIDILRSLPPHDPTVGKDCMVTTIQRSSPHASVRYEPYDLRSISAVFNGTTITVPAAFTPWIVTPEQVVAPSEIAGHGINFQSGGFDFKVEDPHPGLGITVMRGQERRPWRG